MEAKVDVRKLQVLNDRINQTIDALNQVRLSVHGLAHSTAAAANPVLGVNPALNPLGAYSALGQVGFPAFGFAAPQVGLGGAPYAGLQHAAAVPMIGNSFATAIGNPFAAQAAITAPAPWATASGLAHTPDLFEQRMLEINANDPFRLAQTFPYAFSAFTPVIPLW